MWLNLSVCAAVNFCKAASHGVLSRWRVRKGDREQCLGGPTVPLGQGCGIGHSQLSTRCSRWETINLDTLQYCVVGTWSCKGIYLKKVYSYHNQIMNNFDPMIYFYVCFNRQYIWRVQAKNRFSPNFLILTPSGRIIEYVSTCLFTHNKLIKQRKLQVSKKTYISCHYLQFWMIFDILVALVNSKQRLNYWCSWHNRVCEYWRQHTSWQLWHDGSSWGTQVGAAEYPQLRGRSNQCDHFRIQCWCG